MNAAIIGLGNIGYQIKNDSNRNIIWAHSEAYKKHPKVQLVAGCDKDLKTLARFSKSYPSVSCYDEFSEMIRNEKIDILSICTPEKENLEIIKSLIKSNYKPKAIFCEKPLTTSSENANYIAKVCRKNEIILCVNYMRRWETKYKEIKNLISSGSLGEVQSINAYGASAMMTSASHLIDLALFFGGKPVWLIGSLQEDYVRNVRGYDDHGAIALICFENNSFFFLKATSKSEKHYMFEFDIFLTEGRISISNDGQKFQVFKFDDIASPVGSGYKSLVKTKDSISMKAEERMLLAIDDIIEAILNKSETQSNGNNAEEVIRVIEKIKESSRNSNIKVFFNKVNFETI